MAAPLVQRVEIDTTAAQREIAQLERQLLTLNKPINVPVDVDVAGTRQAETQMGGLRREVDRVGDEFTQLDRKAEGSVDSIRKVGTTGTTAFGSLKSSIGAAAAGFAAFAVGAAGFGRFAFGAIQSASSLEESISKTNVVFGNLSSEIQRFAERGPQALGLSTAAALEATSTFGNLFVALGLTQEAAAELSPDIIQLAADLASFNNIGVDEAVEKLRSGLVGEVEPLRTLGVNLNAAMVEAKALALGFVDANGAVTEAGKVQARYALILEQTTTAQGDYARTADGIANTQRTLTAEFENAKTAVGQALLPAFRDLLEAAPGLIARLEELGPAIGVIASATLATLSPLADMVTLMGNLVAPVAGLAASLGELEGLGGGLFNRIAGAFGDALNPIGAFNEGIADLNARISGIDPVKLADLIASTTEAASQGQHVLDLTNQTFTEFLKGSNVTVDALEQIIAATGIADEELTAFLSNTIRNAVRLGLSAAEVRILKDELVALQDFQRRSPGGGRAPQSDPFVKGREAVLAYRDAITKLGGPMDQLQRISQETGFSIDFIAGHAELFGANVQGLVNQLDAGTLAARGFSDGISGIADGITFDTSDAVDELGLLVTAVDKAGKEIPATVRQMNDQLRADANQLADIEAGTLLLDAMGLTSLAAEIRSLPTKDAAAAVEKYLADSVGAVEANTILDKGGNPAEDIIAGINEAIAAGDVTPAMLTYIAGMTSESVKTDILNQALVFGNLTQGAFQDALNALHITLPADFIRVNAEGFLPPTPGGGSGFGPQGTSTTTVTQNFYTEPAPTTTTARAAQEINSIVAGTRR